MKRRHHFAFILSFFATISCIIGQNEASIDTSFGQLGFLNLENLNFHLGESHILHYSFDKNRIDFFQFDLDGQPDETWAPSGQKSFTLEDSLIIKQVLKNHGNGYWVQGETVGQRLFSCRLLDEESIDINFGNNGYLIYPKEFSTSHLHRILNDGRTLILRQNNPGDSAMLYMLKEDLTPERSFGQNGHISFKDNGGYFFSIHTLSDSNYALAEHHEISMVMNASTTTYHFFDDHHRVGTVRKFPGQIQSLSNMKNQELILGWGQYPGDELTAGITRFSFHNGLQPFDTSTEAHNITTIPDKILGFITDLVFEENGDILLGGNLHSSSLSQSRLFVKLLMEDGDLKTRFGDQGSIFFKKPGIDGAYYYSGKVSSKENMVYMSFAVDTGAVGEIQNYLVRLRADYLLDLHGAPSAAPLKLFPNPTDGTVEVELPKHQEISEVEVVDVLGHTRMIGMEKGRIDLSHLSDGHYIIRLLSTDGKWHTGQLQLKR